MKNNYVFKYFTIFCLTFVIIGSILIIVGFNINSKYKEKSKKFEETNAVVVAYENNKSSKNKGTKAIVVEYVVNDKKYRKTSSVYTSNPKKIGEIEKIKYDPTDPSDMIFEKNMETFIFYIIGGVFTIVGTFLSIVFALSYKKEIKKHI